MIQGKVNDFISWYFSPAYKWHTWAVSSVTKRGIINLSYMKLLIIFCEKPEVCKNIVEMALNLHVLVPKQQKRSVSGMQQ